MAYRQLCAVTFAVLGLLAVGCGGDTNAKASSVQSDDQPPKNPDQPSGNPDQVSNSSSDAAPTNPDQPPGNPDALPLPGGGSVGGGDPAGACHALCDSLQDKDCQGAGGIGQAVSLICGSGCVLSAEDQACATEIGAAIACLAGLNGLCTDAFVEADAKACDAAFKAANQCDEQNRPPDNQDTCTTAGGCQCDDDCKTCQCAAGNSAAAKMLCDQLPACQ